MNRVAFVLNDEIENLVKWIKKRIKQKGVTRAHLGEGLVTGTV